ncbi:MAG: hypothetical protein CMJ65_14835 [Planctomycetaceae bacterium]|jgi:hypothetical protein|nr:hypothetical protein [Planctomycetaceae bacterium]
MSGLAGLFTNPLLLWFLPLALIPVLLHLLTLHRLKTVELSTFRFLFDSYVQQRRRMKFLEWLIALLRTLFLLFLVFAISRMRMPDYWETLFGGGAGGRDVVLMLDTSASMGAATDGRTALERSQEAARKVVEKLQPGDHVTVIRVDERPEQLLRRFQASTEEIQNEIDNLETGPSRGNLYAAFSQLFSGDSPEISKLKNPQVFLFTDLQQSGWDEFRGGETAVKVPAGTDLRVVNVGSGRPLDNYAVVGNPPAQSRVIVGLPVTLRPRVANFSLSRNTSSDFAVTISINGQQVDRQPLSVKAGKTEEVEVIYMPNQPGILKGQFEITGDPFLDDNIYRFTLDVRPQVQVLLVNGNPAPIPLDDAGLYVRTALTATNTGDDEPDGDEKPAEAADPAAKDLGPGREFVRALDVHELPEAQLNADALARAAVVILANCGSLDAARFTLLRNFVNKGGGLIVLPGDKVAPDVYTKQFFPDPNDPKTPLLAATLGVAVGDPTKTETFSKFSNIDFSNAILSVFDAGKTPYLTRVQVYRHFALTLPEERGSSWPLIAFAGTDAPAVIEGSYGDGRVVLSAFAFHSKWSNLPMRPEFVPLVLRMVSQVMKRPELDGPSVVPAGGTAEFFAEEAGWDPVSAKVENLTTGVPTPLEQFQRSKSRLVGAFDRTISQGFYDVEVSGGSTARPKQGKLAFAVNLASGESDFRTLGGNLPTTDDPDAMTGRMERVGTEVATMLDGLVPGETLQVVDATAEAQQQYGEPGQQSEIWRWLIFVMFIVIGAEFLLSTLSGQVAEGEEDGALEKIKQLSPGGWVGRMTGADVTEEAPTGAAAE